MEQLFNETDLVQVEDRLALPPSSWCNFTDDVRGNCPIEWDGSLCWRSAAPGETLNQSCPEKFKQYSPHKIISRTCSAEGQWLPPNYVTCFSDAHLEYIREMTKFLRSIKRVAFVGYSTSLVLLIAAFILLVSLKRLRCPRNKLHLHLFASFMLRSLIVVTKFLVFPAGVQSFGSDHTECRIFMVVFHYTLAANYCWILMEGLYLYNLIFMSVYKDNSKITTYVLMGWGFPLPSVVIWTVVKALMDNEDCWVTGPAAVTWIHRGPITFSIVLNFFFFLKITRVVFLKVSSTTAQESRNRNIRYRKWFRSTLVLVPLFGVHYTVLFIVSLVDNDIVQDYWLFIDQIFSSFQGSVVALLYCFFNNEVQSEVIRLLPQGLKSKMSFLKRSATYESSANYSKRDSFNTHRTFSSKSKFFERRQLLQRGSTNQYTTKEELEHTCLCSIENSPPSRGTGFFDRAPAPLDIPKEPHLNESGV